MNEPTLSMSVTTLSVKLELVIYLPAFFVVLYSPCLFFVVDLSPFLHCLLRYWLSTCVIVPITSRLLFVINPLSCLSYLL